MNKDFTNTLLNFNLIHNKLVLCIDKILNPLKFECSEPVAEKESAEYGAYAFNINSMSVLFRVAKTTPTKTGQFVTLWKRIGNGPITPYDYNDPVDLFIIATHKDDHLGYFIFSKSVLCKYNIMSINGKGGKRAIRVYPSWDITTSNLAQKTQTWQLQYFLKINPNEMINQHLAKTLLNTH